MNVRLILSGIAAVIAFDAIASIVSRSTGIPYDYATYGSWILYTILGYVAGKVSPRTALQSAALAGLIFGVADATLGWATSWVLGPGRIAGGITPTQWIVVAAIVTLFATGFATLGGSFARMRRRGRVAE